MSSIKESNYVKTPSIGVPSEKIQKKDTLPTPSVKMFDTFTKKFFNSPKQN